MVCPCLSRSSNPTDRPTSISYVYRACLYVVSDSIKNSIVVLQGRLVLSLTSLFVLVF